MGKSLTFLAICVAPTVVACSTGKDELIAGQKYDGFIQAGSAGIQVPLPQGSWTLVGWGIYPNEQEMGGALIQTVGKNVSKLVDFYVPWRIDPRFPFPVYKFCGRNDVLYMAKEDVQYSYSPYKGNPQNCWGINHWPMTFSDAIPAHLLELRAYVEANGLVMPNTMIAVQYRRVGGSSYFSVNYYFNPELEGIPSPQHIDWRTSDWHRDRALRDPAKKAYINELIKWGKAWLPVIDKGFQGQLTRNES